MNRIHRYTANFRARLIMRLHLPSAEGRHNAPCLRCDVRWPCEPYRAALDRSIELRA